MTPIVGYLRMLIDNELGPTTRGQERALRSMDDCVRRLRSLIDNLIDVTGLETGKMRFVVREFDVAELVRRAVDSASEAARAHGHTLLVEAPARPLLATSDAERLGRALAQLLDNAAKFTPEHGVIGVSLAADGEQIVVTVADSGHGIPPERAAHIFEPFYQVDGSPTRQHGGVGVGLAIARRVAQGLGGDLRLAPGPVTIRGQVLPGAVFVLSLARRASPS
jgi:signal transduction histidine kinase